MDIIFDEATSQVLRELEKTQKEFWNVPRKTGLLLNTFVKMMNAKRVLELGTSNGYSGIWLAKALQETDGILTTVEFYESRQSAAIENFKKCGVYSIVRSIQGSACEVLKYLAEDEKFDFVFIDANKREYREYFKLVKPHLTEKAMIVADNIISHAEKVQPFIDAIDEDKEFQYTILEVPGGLLTAYRG